MFFKEIMRNQNLFFSIEANKSNKKIKYGMFMSTFCAGRNGGFKAQIF